jgi:hypothetical protein
MLKSREYGFGMRKEFLVFGTAKTYEDESIIYGNDFSTYRGTPLQLDYKHCNANGKWEFSKYVGRNIIECQIEYEKETGKVNYKLLQHSTINDIELKTESLKNKNFDSPTAFVQSLDQSGIYYELISRVSRNVFNVGDKDCYGYRKVNY